MSLGGLRCQGCRVWTGSRSMWTDRCDLSDRKWTRITQFQQCQALPGWREESGGSLCRTRQTSQEGWAQMRGTRFSSLAEGLCYSKQGRLCGVPVTKTASPACLNDYRTFWEDDQGQHLCLLTHLLTLLLTWRRVARSSSYTIICEWHSGGGPDLR